MKIIHEFDGFFTRFAPQQLNELLNRRFLFNIWLIQILLVDRYCCLWWWVTQQIEDLRSIQDESVLRSEVECKFSCPQLLYQWFTGRGLHWITEWCESLSNDLSLLWKRKWVIILGCRLLHIWWLNDETIIISLVIDHWYRIGDQLVLEIYYLILSLSWTHVTPMLKCIPVGVYRASLLLVSIHMMCDNEHLQLKLNVLKIHHHMI